MPRQRDLLERGSLEVRPESGRSEPRLWIRRLVIWSEPGKVLREIRLRPGLNIIWSPDPGDQTDTGDQDDGLGHGSGKTLFCRLLRYVLGEDHFATHGQRYSIAGAFPEGVVGAEIQVTGTLWSVLRPFSFRGHHVAVADMDLDQVIAGNLEATGLHRFLAAIENEVLSNEVAELIRGEQAHSAWLVALSWLSRDQECRFDRVLDWRSPDSDSGSPTRNLSATKLLDAVRALIGAIVPEELEHRAEVLGLENEQKERAREAEQLSREAMRLRAKLMEELDLDQASVPPGRLAIEPLHSAAKARLAKLAAARPGTDVTNLGSLRSQEERARADLADREKELARIEGRIPEIEKEIARIEGEIPGSSSRLFMSANPVCPICEVPIDQALAEGCKLSHKLPDLASAEQRLASLRQELSAARHRLADNKARQKGVGDELLNLSKIAGELSQQLRAAEKARDSRSDAWYNHRRRLDDVSRLDELLTMQARTGEDAIRLELSIERRRGRTGAFRDAQAGVFRRLSVLFDGIIRDVVGSEASGSVALDGTGLKLKVELGGDRSTAAIDSLKIIAFDLAVMCMSIEGGVRLPAFLIHDSPREADLGLSVYHRLFRLVQRLESSENQSLFQYIVTTTTPPPDETRSAPWLAATLGGTPAAERLLKRNL